MISSIIFILIFAAAVFLFAKNVRIIATNIKRGKSLTITDKPNERWKLMALVALGQSKMLRNPIVGILHLFVYIGFLVVNIEMLEILTDGIFGTHRIFSFFGSFYPILVSTFEIFAVLVIVACITFLIRRNLLKVKRFQNPEMTAWPRTDANIILFTEVLLMSAFLAMNAADSILQIRGAEHYTAVGSFAVSQFLVPLFENLSTGSLIFIERFGWWFHIVGVLAFLNYIPYSKHFHVFLAFPNVYYSKLKPRAYVPNMQSITNEVKIAMGLAQDTGSAPPDSFGAKDVTDLSWKNLMDAYSCTECGRCTAVCPANVTGKKLSPRKIIMDTRDRLEEFGKFKVKNPSTETDGKMLLENYISPEELWACTTCNACAQECPVNIDQPAIIIEMRRYLFMEKSAAPSPINQMSTNIENNGAPWQYSTADRLNWANELYINDKMV
ncbi:MAG TPA: Fe-S oxidoreductase [Bacteroidales bacterium]|nr:Fe-S oxidoreductase [Bacteroidales bacterium]